jgi:hypothetical protein
VQVYTVPIQLPTYPIRDFLSLQLDPLYNIPVLYLNRPAYEASNPKPNPVEYEGVVLENDYLRLTFLPEVGGRLYSAVIKATGQEIFYHNPVIKPSRYGGLQPPESNWWLATGGMEWAYPTQEHGYRWGVPWSYQVDLSESGATITLSDTGPERVGAQVQVTLPADSPVFTVAPSLINGTGQSVPVQFWLNAALTLGADSMSLDTQFVVPASQIQIHSRGANGWSLPDSRQFAAWPQAAGLDLSHYRQWTDYLGFFLPDTALPFMGAYNPDTKVGVVRLAAGGPPGAKLFAFGQDFWDKSYTDNNSQYFEIWGGANAGFWPEADLPVAAGATLTWQEQWWPLAGLPGLTWATPQVALSVSPTETGYELAALFARPQHGQLSLSAAGVTLLEEPFGAGPDRPEQWSVNQPSESLSIRFSDDQGQVLLDYCINC